jgi:1-acyl-sn-glycerol-3-phosphate acyltransferase
VLETPSYNLDKNRAFFGVLFWIAKYVFWLALKLLCRLKVEGKEHLPDRGPLIITCNHFSYIDSLIIAAAFRKRFYIGAAKKKLLSSPFMRFFMKLLNTLVFEDSESFVADAVALLKQGKVMVIYPALARSRDGRLQPFKPDLGKIVLKSGAPVIPSYIGGSFDVMAPGDEKLKRGKLSIRFGGVMQYGAAPQNSDFEAESLRITDEIRESIKRMLEADEKGGPAS